VRKILIPVLVIAVIVLGTGSALAYGAIIKTQNPPLQSCVGGCNDATDRSYELCVDGSRCGVGGKECQSHDDGQGGYYTDVMVLDEK
jgi:hypothetical protein